MARQKYCGFQRGLFSSNAIATRKGNVWFTHGKRVFVIEFVFGTRIASLTFNLVWNRPSREFCGYNDCKHMGNSNPGPKTIYTNTSLSCKLTSLKVIRVIKIIFKRCHARGSAAKLNIITDDGDVVVGQIWCCGENAALMPLHTSSFLQRLWIWDWFYFMVHVFMQ